MPHEIARVKYRKMLEDISTIYEAARQVLVEAYWKIGRILVEVEQDGAVRASYGKGLLQSFTDELSAKYGAGFSVDNLEKMRRFYLQHKNSAAPRKLDWTQFFCASLGQGRQ